MSVTTWDDSSAEEVMARAGKTFYRAARLLPRPIRTDVVALYAFCRHVDDLADGASRPLQERHTALQELSEALAGSHPRQPRAAGWPFAAQGMLPQAAALLVQAALGDLQQVQPETLEALLEYAFGVAGTVGIMMAVVLRARPEGFGAAVALGMAMQLSNISRDVAEDFHHGRVYLPAQWVDRQAVRCALNAETHRDAELVRRSIRRLLTIADALYEIAYDGIWSLPWRIRWSILAAAMCYREIGKKVGRDVDRSWKQRTVVSSGRKLWLTALAGLRLLLPRFWRRATHVEWPTALGHAALAQGRALGVAQ